MRKPAQAKLYETDFHRNLNKNKRFHMEPLSKKPSLSSPLHIFILWRIEKYIEFSDFKPRFSVWQIYSMPLYVN